jgi:ABC-type transport system involved in multi-copper enzyme maturation permease subunit
MVRKGIWKKELRAGRWKFIAGLPILVLTAVSIPLVFEYTLRFMDSAPVPEFARGQVALLKDFRFFVWSQWFGKNLTQMGTIIAIIFGAGIVSSEVTRRTIQFLLVKPVRREEIFTVKYIVNLASIALITVIASFSLYITLAASNQTYPAVHLIEQTVLAVAGLSVVYSIAVYFSTIFDQAMRSALASIFAVFLLYIPGWVPFMEKYSLFYQMSGPGIYAGQGFPLVTLVVFAAITTTLYYLGRKRFANRDF